MVRAALSVVHACAVNVVPDGDPVYAVHGCDGRGGAGCDGDSGDAGRDADGPWHGMAWAARRGADAGRASDRV